MRKPLHISSWLVVALIASQSFAEIARTAERPENIPAVVIPIRGEINDFSSRGFLRRLNQARELGAKEIVIELDTPGGAVISSLDITHAIRALGDIHSIAYVNPRAYSAGSMIAVSCDKIAMAPGAVIGDCATIRVSSSGELQPLPPTERAKFDSPVLADFMESARRNGYEPKLMEAMVIADRVLYLLENSAGEYRVADEADYKKLTSDGSWKLTPNVRQPIDSTDTLLTVSTDLALKIGLAKFQASSIDDLAAQQHLNVIATLEPASGEKIIELLSSDWARALLLSIFLTSLYAALHAPGHGVSEAIALVTLSLLLGVPLLTGYAQWWEIVAILVGICLVALEIFVIPGFGVLGILGIVLIFGGFLLTFVAPEPGNSPIGLPSLAMNWSSIREGLLVIVSGMTCSLLLSTWLRRYLPKLPYFRGLILNTAVGTSDSAMVGSLTNIDPMSTLPAIGSIGRAATDLRPGGSAEFRDVGGAPHVIAVISDSGFVDEGSPVRVREAAGNRVIVYSAEPKDQA